jgi:hypothetical protein
VTYAEDGDLQVYERFGFAAYLEPEVGDAGDSIEVEATDGACTAVTTFTLPGSAGNAPPATPSAAPCGSSRSLADRPDDTRRFQIHAIYAVPSDSIDAGLDTTGEIARSLDFGNEWFREQTGGSELRLDTCDGEIDITYLPLPWPEAAYGGARAWRDSVINHQVVAAGFTAPNKIYAIWWAGLGFNEITCGGLTLMPSDPGATTFIVTRMPTGRSCERFGLKGTNDNLIWIHEVLHALGHVSECAPNGQPPHVRDRYDLMFGQFPPFALTVLDVDHDDYYMHEIRGCPDLADSVFLDPLPARARRPPGW